ncbi:ParM/StbA family protein [Fischerella sp. PCC 9605]|uniref:ParM/StbA family protein n=1 Tax=Fischerella sp. PCC 9605 TaxID=1173024 RepID=UPI00047B9AF4|nr:hypothetical protein [Fischerella sp. PCC 9605]
MAEKTTQNPTLLVSADHGNRKRKQKVTRIGVGEKTKIKVSDSGLQFTREGFEIDPAQSDVFYCKHSTSKTWRDKCWYETSKGLHPYDLNGSELCFGDTGKSVMALPLLISGIWDEIKDGDVVALNASVQNIHTNRSPMTAELEGTHTIICNGKVKRITILKPDIYTEGVGALLVQKPKRDDVSMLLDLGGDTVIVSFFDGVKLRGNVTVTPGLGVNQLIAYVRDLPEVNTILGRCPYNNDEALEIIEGRTEKDFTQAIEKAVVCWIDRIKTAVLNTLSFEMHSSNNRYAIGGGADIKGVEKALKALKIDVIPSPQMANVTGLHDKLLNQYGLTPVKTTKKAKA